MVENSSVPEAQRGPVKIAVITNDGVNIAAHFGMAEFYEVITVKDGKASSKEKRPKPHHVLHPNSEQSQQHDHEDMLDPIRDCQVLLSGGMRSRAYAHAETAGLQVIMTVGNIDEAIQKYLNKELVSDTRRIRTI